MTQPCLIRLCNGMRKESNAKVEVNGMRMNNLNKNKNHASFVHKRFSTFVEANDSCPNFFLFQWVDFNSCRL